MQYQENLQLYFQQIFGNIRQDTYQTAIFGIRPYRKGGLRIQPQFLKQKVIIHNYGHGGAGISLAPATAKQVGELLLQSGAQFYSDQVAILGSGINGLFCALQSINLGYHTTVYAQRFPEINSTNSLKMCTSEVPPGYWLPYGYEFSDQEQHEKRSVFAFKQYLKLLKNLKSLHLTEAIEPLDMDFNGSKIPKFLKKFCRQEQLLLNNIRHKVLRFFTIQINLQQFLQDLMKMCSEKGVRFVERKFEDFNDVALLKQKFMINCLGMGSKYIFNDDKMYGKKGYLLRFDNVSRIKWGIYGFKFRQYRVKIYMLPSKILFGVFGKEYSQTKQIEETVIKQIKDILSEFLKQVAYQVPKL